MKPNRIACAWLTLLIVSQPGKGTISASTADQDRSGSSRLFPLDGQESTYATMIAYIRPMAKPENQELYQLLNTKGIMCLILAASSLFWKPWAPNQQIPTRESLVAQGGFSIRNNPPSR